MEIDGYRIDHLGLVAQMAEDIGLVENVNSCLGIENDHIVTPGQAVLAMVLNCLGFTSRPLYITPSFFDRRHLPSLLGPGNNNRIIEPEHLNQHKLGRVLDDIAGFDPEKFFMEVAIPAFRQQGVTVRQLHLDTTSHSMTGQYEDEAGNPLVGDLGTAGEPSSYSIEIVRGYSKAHRPDLKQAVQELLVSSDGDVPLMLKVFSGNKNDSTIMQERINELKNQLIKMKAQDLVPNIIVADSKFFCEKTITKAQSEGLLWVTRVPETCGDVAFNINKAISARNQWIKMTEENGEKPASGLCYQEFTVDLFGIYQSFIVIRTDTSKNRAERTVDLRVEREAEKIESAAKKLSKKTFSSKDDLLMAWDDIFSKVKYHIAGNLKIEHVEAHASRGRPKRDAIPKFLFHISSWEFEIVPEKIRHDKLSRACFVLGTNATIEQLSTKEVVRAYMKEQQGVERSFRFLKDDQYFTEAFFLKNPARIASLLCVMTISLLVYSLLQRRLRLNIASNEGSSLPDQKGKPTQRPTLRWVNTMFEGVDVIIVSNNKKKTIAFKGLSEFVQETLRLMGPPYQGRYSPNIFMTD
jgi:transposase